MGFIRFCVDHPVTIWMIIILLVSMGVLSIVYMDVELLPNISVPTLVVITKMIKASPEEIQEKITLPLEEILNTVSDLKSVASRSKEGVSQIKLEFQWGKNVDLAIMEVKEKLYKARLPEEADAPYIWRWDPASEPIFRFDIYDKTGKMDLPRLKELAEKKVKPRIERIKGVGSVAILGGKEREFKVVLSKQLLEAKYLSILQIIDKIQKENLNFKAGKIEGERDEFLVRVIGKSKDAQELGNIVIATRKDPVYGKMEQILLKDVAKIEDGYKDTESKARINGNVSIGFSIKKTAGGNVVNVIDMIKFELEKLRGFFCSVDMSQFETINDTLILEETKKAFKENRRILSQEAKIQNITPNKEWLILEKGEQHYLARSDSLIHVYLKEDAIIPPDIDILVSRDDSEYILKSQSIVLSNIFQGVVLAFLLVMFFVRDLRGSILIGMSIPFSVIAAFAVLYANGSSLNILTLGGMALAAGMVLDCSIVILENIHTHIEFGKNVKAASIDGTTEVAMGVLTASLTTVLAFLPLLYTKGIMKEIFRDLTLAIIYSVVFSGIIALIFMPMMGSRIIKRRATLDEMGFIKRTTMILLSKFDDLMENSVEWIARLCIATRLRRIVIMTALIVACIISIFAIPPQDFIPKGKVREIQIEIETPPGSTLEYTNQQTLEVEKVLKTFTVDFPDKVAKTETATAEVYAGNATIFLKIQFISKDTRKSSEIGLSEKAWQWFVDYCLGGLGGYAKEEVLYVVERLRETVKKEVAKSGDVYVNVLEKVNPQGSIPLKVCVVAKDPVKYPLPNVRDYVKQYIVPEVQNIPGSIYFRTARVDAVPELEIKLDKQKITDLSGDTKMIAISVRCFITGYVPASIEVDGEEVDIRVQGTEKERDTEDAIRTITFMNPRVPNPEKIEDVNKLTLGEISNIRKTDKEAQIERKDKKPTIVLQCNQVPYNISGKTLGTIMYQLETSFASSSFPSKAPTGEKFKDIFIYSYEGQAQDLIESSESAFWALVLSIIMIYMVMCCQFESLFDPFIIMVTIPLSFPGIVWLLSATKEEYSLSAMVGFICLGGVAVNNGIYIIEFTNIERERGVEMSEALVQASRRKLRSILITSFTTVLGMLPIVMGMGEGTELYRGCCAVILGGLTISTPLALFAVPVLYLIMQDVRELLSLLWLKVVMLFTKA